LARDRHLTGFPEFEQFCIHGFPRSTQATKSVASTVPPRPHRILYSRRWCRRQNLIVGLRGAGGRASRQARRHGVAPARGNLVTRPR
jgi:hypothetical protein